MDENNNVNVVKKDNKTLMGVLAYLGILVLIPFFMAKDDPFVKFHIKQGLVLMVIELIIWILGSMFWSYTMYSFMQLLNLIVIIFSIIGIVNVVQKQQKELPLLGKFSKYFTF